MIHRNHIFKLWVPHSLKRGGMLRQARFEFVRGQRRRTGVQGKPGPESVVVSGLCCVSTVVVNRCSEHLSEPRPGHNWKLADDLPETNRELAGLRGLPDRSSGVVDCGRVLYPLPQSTAVYRVDGRGFTPQNKLCQEATLRACPVCRICSKMIVLGL